MVEVWVAWWRRMGRDDARSDGMRAPCRCRVVTGVNVEAYRIDMLERLVDVGYVGYLCCLRRWVMRSRLDVKG